MQVKIKQEPKVFKPVTLELIFESKDELEMYRKIMACDLSVPSKLYEEDNPKFAQASELMTDIFNCVDDLIRGIEREG